MRGDGDKAGLVSEGMLGREKSRSGRPQSVTGVCKRSDLTFSREVTFSMCDSLYLTLSYRSDELQYESI